MSGDSYVREKMGLFNKITLAIVGIGAIAHSSMLARSGNTITPREHAEVEEAGGVGDISVRFFDAQGRFIPSSRADLVMGLNIGELSKVDRVIARAGGQAKTDAIRGALNTGIIDLLITDKFTAQRLTESATVTA